MADVEKGCRPMPCPPWTEGRLDIVAICECPGRIPAGELFAPGCPIHDPAVKIDG